MVRGAEAAKVPVVLVVVKKQALSESIGVRRGRQIENIPLDSLVNFLQILI